MSVNGKKKKKETNKEFEYKEGEIYIQGEYIDGEYVEYEVMYLDGEFVPIVYEDEPEEYYEEYHEDEMGKKADLVEELSFEKEDEDDDLVFLSEEEILNAGNTSNLMGVRWALDLEDNATEESDATKSENAKTEDAKAEDAKAEDAKAEDAKAEDAKAEETKAEETKAEDVKAEDVKAEDSKAEDAKTEDADEEGPKETDEKSERVEDTKTEEKSERVEDTKTEEKSEIGEVAKTTENSENEEVSESGETSKNAEESDNNEKAEESNTEKETKESKPEEERGKEKSEEESETETVDAKSEDTEESETGDAKSEDTEESEAADAKPKREPMDPAKKKKIFRIAGISVAALLVVTYFAMALYYHNYLFPNTVINGISCNNILPEEAMTAILEADNQYTLEICGREGMTATISANDIGYGFDYVRTAEDIKQEQNGLLWPSAYFSPQIYVLEGTPHFDEALLQAKLDEIDFLQESSMENPQDAHIGAYDRENGGFFVVPETKGTALDREKVYEIIKNALSQIQSSVDLDATACYLEASIKSDDPALNQEATRLNGLTQAMITYQFGDVEEVVDGGVFIDWIDPVTKEVDPEKVTEYLTELSEKYNTYGVNENFTTLQGYELNLPKGRFGWKIDIEAETKALIEDIQSGVEVTREPVFAVKGAQWGENDIGTFYVEIDMTNQMVYLVDNGVVRIQTPCVTGNVASGNTTPPGIFGVTYRQTNATLRGATYTSFVHYWMPFNGNIGMHDATWRGRFGGEIYRTSGSHGCVNLPKAAAAKIFESIYQGCPVICYYLTEDYIISAPETEKEIVLAEDAYVYGTPTSSASPSAPAETPGIPQETTPEEAASPVPSETPAETPPVEETPGIPHETTPEEAAAQAAAEAAAQAAAEAAAQAAAEAAAQAAAEAAAQAAAEAAAQAAAQGQ